MRIDEGSSATESIQLTLHADIQHFELDLFDSGSEYDATPAADALWWQGVEDDKARHPTTSTDAAASAAAAAAAAADHGGPAAAEPRSLELFAQL